VTQPDQYFPETATNYDSFADYAATTQEEWEAQMRSPFDNIFTTILGALFDGLEAGVSFTLAIISKIVSTLLGLDPTTLFVDVASALVDLASWGVNTVVGGIQATIDALLGGFIGAGSGGSSGDVLTAAEMIAESIAACRALLEQNAAPDYEVDFSTKPNSSSLPSEFTVSYVGTGTGTWGVSGGKTYWDPAFDHDRTALARYNAATTTTDDQIIGAIFTTLPGAGTPGGANFILGRCDSALTDFVYVGSDGETFELGCYVGGAQTIFTTLSHPFKINTAYYLRCGVGGTSRRFQVYENDLPIIDHTEVGTTSQVDSSHRYGGMAGFSHEGVILIPFPVPIAQVPAKCVYWFMSDG
jgi:hypothetical protein